MKLTTDSLSLFINSLYLTPEKYFLCKDFMVPLFLLLSMQAWVEIQPTQILRVVHNNLEILCLKFS